MGLEFKGCALVPTEKARRALNRLLDIGLDLEETDEVNSQAILDLVEELSGLCGVGGANTDMASRDDAIALAMTEAERAAYSAELYRQYENQAARRDEIYNKLATSKCGQRGA
jgi:hypothetical protein